jgi:hypothetical protein
MDVQDHAKAIRHRCRICLVETNHRIQFATSLWRSYPYDDQDREQYGDTYEEQDDYILIQCCGCDDIRLKVTSRTELYGNPYEDSVVYPPDQIRHWPEWVYTDLQMAPNIFGRPEKNPGRRELLAEIRKFLREIYQALGGGSHRLAIMGVRALVERIMIQEVGDRHSFEQNINAFFESGYVAVAQQEMFRSQIEAGHAAMHRGWEPKRDDVMTVLDIVESLIKALYVDQKRAATVAKRIPPRVPRIPKERPPKRSE